MEGPPLLSRVLQRPPDSLRMGLCLQSSLVIAGRWMVQLSGILHFPQVPPKSCHLPRPITHYPGNPKCLFLPSLGQTPVPLSFGHCVCFTSFKDTPLCPFP